MQHRILIVDDNPMNVSLLEDILGDEYEHIATAGSGEEALDVAERFHPTLILLDIMMPGIDGYETCRRLRNNSDLKYVKIVLVSAKAMVSERLQGYEVCRAFGFPRDCCQGCVVAGRELPSAHLLSSGLGLPPSQILSEFRLCLR